MEHFTIVADDHTDALNKMRSRYGNRVKHYTYRHIKHGGFLGLFQKDGIEYEGLALEKSNEQQTALMENKKKILEAAGKKSSSQDDLKTVLDSMEKLRAEVSRIGANKSDQTAGLPPAMQLVKEILERNEFQDDFISRIIEKAKRELTFEEMADETLCMDKLGLWVSENLTIYPEIKFNAKGRGPRIIILVGPTGVGKTTTIPKLAALYGMKRGKQGTSRVMDVRMVSLDNYRIGAFKQIESYGEIMEFPVYKIENQKDLKMTLASCQEADLVLVDTMGRSPREFQKLAELREMLEGFGREVETFLTVSSTTKTNDLQNILRQYEPFEYESVIITKLDETTYIGNILSVLSENKKKIAYLTHGQAVPGDIKKASLSVILDYLEGINLNTEEVEQKALWKNE